MRKLSLLLILLVSIFTSRLAAQPQSIECNPGAEKISFQGAAPSPWAIDGNVADWETILGPGNGNSHSYYNPPTSTGFNWAIDGYHLGQNNFGDLDNPDPAFDLRYLSFIHDDYNVYFYMRRIKKSNGSASVYYFCDINADGFMNTGEPVFKASFTAQTITSLSLCRYITNTGIDYTPGKGNYMFLNCFVDGYSIKGSLEEIFNSSAIPAGNTLLPHEIFSAALTENGMGVELAIPWKYLKNWTSGSTPLSPGNIFFYHVSTLPGNGSYQPGLVADNAGACLKNVGLYGNTLGMSGHADFQLQTGTVTPLGDGLSFRFKLDFVNNTNANEVIKIGASVYFNNIVAFPGLPVNEQDFTVTIYPDINCNGIVDPGELPTNYIYIDGTLAQQPISYGDPSTFFSPSVQAAPYGNACFIIDISLPSNHAIQSLHIEFQPKATFDLPSGCQLGDGGKTINPVGYNIEDEEPSGTIKTPVKPEQGKAGIRVYPNPTRSELNVSVPESSGNINIEIYDLGGKLIVQRNNVRPGLTQFRDLTPGVYLMKLTTLNDRYPIMIKVMVTR